jgi:hypothetical protein
VLRNPPASVSGNSSALSGIWVGRRIGLTSDDNLPSVHVPMSGMRQTRICSSRRPFISRTYKISHLRMGNAMVVRQLELGTTVLLRGVVEMRGSARQLRIIQPLRERVSATRISAISG